MNSGFMTKVKENIRIVNLLLFALCAICWILPMYTFSSAGYYGYGGFSFSISAFQWLFQVSIAAILLFAPPIFGFVYLFVLSKGKSRQQHAMYLGLAHAAGLLILIIMGAFGIGGILSLLAYAAGLAANGMIYLNK